MLRGIVMKKYVSAGLAAVLLLTLLCGCAKTPVAFAEGSHPRDDVYAATFKTQYATEGSVTLHVASAIFTEEAARQTLAAVQADYAKISKLLGGAQPVTVYAVEQTIAGVPQVMGSQVFCTLDDIAGGQYRDSLARAALGSPFPWQGIGVSRLAFEGAPDTEALKAYYGDEANLNTLSMFAPYFMAEFADADTVAIARDTAAAVAAFAIGKDAKGFAASGSSAEIRQQWIASIGASAVYPTDDVTAAVDRMTFDASGEYPLILTGGVARFYIKTDNHLMQTPAEIYAAMREYFIDMNTTMAFIEQRAPEFYARIAPDYAANPVAVYYKDYTISHASGQRAVFIEDSYDLCHEIVHILLEPTLALEDRWLDEGLTTMFALPAGGHALTDAHRQVLLDFLYANPQIWGLSPGDVILRERAAKYYEMRAPRPSAPAEFDFALFYESVGAALLAEPNLQGITLMMANTSFAERRAQIGGAAEPVRSPQGSETLTYPEALAMTLRLGEKVGFDRILSAVRNGDNLDELFGMDFGTMLAHYRAELAALLK